MSDSLHEQIYDILSQKDTDELLEIWQTNDHVEWTDSAFETIKEILIKRSVELPEQDEPILEYFEEDEFIKRYKLTEEDLRIIEDENPPVFYDPFDVVVTTKRIEFAAIISVILVTTSKLLQFRSQENFTRSLLQAFPSLGILVFPITLIAVTIAIALLIVTTYFPLKALAYILRILMEMEFNSRIDK